MGPFPDSLPWVPSPPVPGAGCLVDTVGLLAPTPSQSSVSLWNMLPLPPRCFAGEGEKNANKTMGRTKLGLL